MSSSPTSSSSTETASAVYSGMLDVTCRVDVIVGTGSITVRDCLKLQRDSIVRLTQTAGSDLQVVVQGVPTATGEIVIDEDTKVVAEVFARRPGYLVLDDTYYPGWHADVDGRSAPVLASNAAFRAGHSESRIEYHAVSRFCPFTI